MNQQTYLLRCKDKLDLCYSDCCAEEEDDTSYTISVPIKDLEDLLRELNEKSVLSCENPGNNGPIKVRVYPGKGLDSLTFQYDFVSFRVPVTKVREALSKTDETVNLDDRMVHLRNCNPCAGLL